jgi:histidinol-phosphate aminotransferase
VHISAQVMPVIVRPLIGYSLPEHLRISIGAPEQNDRLLLELPAAI